MKWNGFVVVFAGLSHYKNRIDKQRTVDGSMGSSSSALLSMPRLDNQGGCKTERLHTLSTPLGPYDKNYSRKRLREHSLERADSEFPLTHPHIDVLEFETQQLHLCVFTLHSLPETFPGHKQPLHNTGQHTLIASQPSDAPAVHVVRYLHTARHRQPGRLQHTGKDAPAPPATVSLEINWRKSRFHLRSWFNTVNVNVALLLNPSFCKNLT